MSAEADIQRCPTTVTGQITFRRRLSSKLVFYDIIQPSNAAVPFQWVELIVKAGIYGSIQDVKDLRDMLKLGDLVQAEGYTESTGHHTVLQAVKVTVIKPWKEQQPGVAFNPQPAPKAQQQQQQQIPCQTDVAQQQHQAADEIGRQALSQEQPRGPQQPVGSSSSSELPTQQHPPASDAAETDVASVAPAAAAPSVAKVVGPQLSLCKFWINTGRCFKGDACPYLHTLLPAAGGAISRSHWVQQRRSVRQERSALQGLVHDASAAAKRRRAQVLAEWLLQQFGRDTLNAGCGVLDVAGGRGALTYELVVVHGIKCTLIDPRPLKLNKHQIKQLAHSGRTANITTLTEQQLMPTQQEMQQQDSVSISQQPHHHHQQQQQQHDDEDISRLQDDDAMSQLRQEKVAYTVLPPPPAQTGLAWQQADDGLATAAGAAEVGADMLTEARESGTIASVCQQHKSEHSVNTGEGVLSVVHLQQLQAWFTPQLWSSAAWQQLFGACSLVVGLHPDQATEPIVDYALQQQVPFAVVPCCVFPRLFPDRRLFWEGDVEATPVVSYTDLVEYLTQKCAGAQRQVLDFEGANTVVFRH